MHASLMRSASSSRQRPASTSSRRCRRVISRAARKSPRRSSRWRSSSRPPRPSSHQPARSALGCSRRSTKMSAPRACPTTRSSRRCSWTGCSERKRLRTSLRRWRRIRRRSARTARPCLTAPSWSTTCWRSPSSTRTSPSSSWAHCSASMQRRRNASPRRCSSRSASRDRSTRWTRCCTFNARTCLQHCMPLTCRLSTSATQLRVSQMLSPTSIQSLP
mmetsp:Transcript_1264/g.2649  ORF Transcript_1264/g.2649 Transcript_1264/m.2649 type:complete len:218 (-) Transcript_1264:171-824(-)